MKITQKLYALIVVALVLVMAVYSGIAYQRESVLFELDMRKDAQLLGQTLVSIISGSDSSQTAQSAIKIIDNVGKIEDEFAIRWVWLVEDNRDTEHSPQVPLQRLAHLRELKPVDEVAQVDSFVYVIDGKQRLYTYVTAQISGYPLGAVELSESMESMQAYTFETIIQLLLLSVLLVVSGALIMGGAGHYLITARIKRLVLLAREIGQDNYSSQWHDPAADELAELGKELQLMNKQLQEKRAQLERENQAKLAIKEQLRHAERLKILGQLASGVAHELGTPLNVILGRAKLIVSDEQATETVSANAQIIQKQVNRMSDMIKQLLNFARRQKPQKKWFVLFERVNHLVKLLRQIAAKSQVVITINNKVAEQAIKADLNQLEQVLSNLIINGIQAMPSGGQLTITLEIQWVSPPTSSKPIKCYLIEVADTGQGIAAETEAKIFEPFYSTKKAGVGTGLGLSIANDIVQEHHGWIEVNSQLGQGSRFIIHLPMENTP